MDELEEDIVPEDEFDGGGEASLKRLREKLALCVKEKQEYLDGWQRMRADVANMKRDEETRRTQLGSLARFGMIEEIIPVLDSFDLALASTGESGEWKSGIENIRSQLLGVLKKNGVTPFEPLGESFDPALHEPVSSERVTEKEKDHTVVAVLQRGYRSDGQVIRPAKVTIGHFEEKN